MNINNMCAPAVILDNTAGVLNTSNVCYLDLLNLLKTNDLKISHNKLLELQKVKSRRKTLKKFIVKTCLMPYKFFITFTFNDESLNNTCIDTRKRRLKKLLNTYFERYVANEDYGGLNGRFHYHAVCGSNCCISYSDIIKTWSYGSVKISIIYDTDNLNLYMTKLYNHAKKITSSTIIYSRKKFKRKK